MVNKFPADEVRPFSLVTHTANKRKKVRKRLTVKKAKPICLAACLRQKGASGPYPLANPITAFRIPIVGAALSSHEVAQVQ